MRFTNFIREEFVTGFNTTSNGYVEVFSNEIPRELKRVSVRFLVDITKKTVYFWDANKALHQTVYNELGFKGNVYQNGYISGEIKDKKVMFSSEMSRYMKILDLYKNDLSFMEKYVKGFKKHLITSMMANKILYK